MVLIGLADPIRAEISRALNWPADTAVPLSSGNAGRTMIRTDLGYCELTFRPSPDLVSVVRRFVSDFYAKVFESQDDASRVALATHELLENAVKYSSGGDASIRINVAEAGPLAQVQIRTCNQARPEDVACVRRQIEEMKSAENRFDYYQELMRTNAQRSDGSGLGLARVHAEAEMDMSLEHCDEGQVTLVAQTIVALPLEEAS